MKMNFKSFSSKSIGNIQIKMIDKSPSRILIRLEPISDLPPYIDPIVVDITEVPNSNKLVNVSYTDLYNNELFNIVTNIISLNSFANDIFQFICRNPEEYFEYLKSTGKVKSTEDMLKLCSDTYVFYNIESTDEYDIRCTTGYFVGCDEIFIRSKKESPYNREIKLFTDSIEITDNDESIKNIHYNKRNLL